MTNAFVNVDSRVKTTDIHDWINNELDFLNKVKPEEWINIAAPVRDAVIILKSRFQSINDRFAFITANYKQMEERFRRKEKRQKDSIEEVMNFVKDKFSTQQKKTEALLASMQASIK